MNNRRFSSRLKGCAAAFCILFLCSAFLQAETKRGKEDIGTIEIPVRVFFEGKAVSDLSKADFQIYDDDKLQTINDVVVKRKGIASRSGSGCFILVCNIIAYNKQVKESLAYIFNNVLREQDRLMILSGNTTILFNNIIDKEKSLSRAEKVLRQQSELTAKIMKTDIIKAEELIGKLRADYLRNVSNRIGPDNQGKIYQHYYMTYFRAQLRRYLDMLLDYNKRYLLPDLDRYYLFARDIEKIDREKWIIHLYQAAEVPRLAKRNRAMIKKMIADLADSESPNPDDEYDFEKKIVRLLGAIDDALRVTSGFESEEISQLLYKIDATFHSVFLDNGKAPAEEQAKDPGQRSVSKSIVDHLSKIAAAAGGRFVDLRDAGATLDTLINSEDLYYLLSYAPAVPDKTGKISVAVSNNDYQVQFNADMKADSINEYLGKRAGEINRVRVKNVSFKQKRLYFEIANFLMQKEQNEAAGKLHVHIRLEDKNSTPIFDQNKTLQVKKDIVAISIGLNLRKKETYDLMVKVTDLLSGETYLDYRTSFRP